MVKYINLGFTEREAEVLGELLEKWQTEGGNLAESYVMTPAGAEIQCQESFWAGEYYLSLIARRENFAVALDTGHGFLFLIDTATGEAAHGKEQVLLNEAAVLDAEYYGLDKFYIYIR